VYGLILPARRDGTQAPHFSDKGRAGFVKAVWIIGVANPLIPRTVVIVVSNPYLHRSHTVINFM
jgi:hypothetical protein